MRIAAGAIAIAALFGAPALQAENPVTLKTSELPRAWTSEEAEALVAALATRCFPVRVVEPLPRGGGFEFVDEVKGGAIPSVFISAVEKGVRVVLESGYFAGYPIQDLRVAVFDG